MRKAVRVCVCLYMLRYLGSDDPGWMESALGCGFDLLTACSVCKYRRCQAIGSLVLIYSKCPDIIVGLHFQLLHTQDLINTFQCIVNKDMTATWCLLHYVYLLYYSRVTH